MVKIVKNNTKQTQQIMFIGGTCVTFHPGETRHICIEEISKDELERIKKFFIFNDGQEVVIKYKKNIAEDKYKGGGVR